MPFTAPINITSADAQHVIRLVLDETCKGLHERGADRPTICDAMLTVATELIEGHLAYNKPPRLRLVHPQAPSIQGKLFSERDYL